MPHCQRSRYITAPLLLRAAPVLLSVRLVVAVSDDMPVLRVTTTTGGAISTIVDVLGTMALLSNDSSRAGVSIEMNQTFVGAAKLGSTLTLTGTLLKSGRSMGFTQVTIVDAESGALLASGRHTKAFPPNRTPLATSLNS